MKDYETRKERIGVIGLGYVGLPLACMFSKEFEVRGYDISSTRVARIRDGNDSTRELTPEELGEAFHRGFDCSDAPEILEGCSFYVVAVPTPVDTAHNPDLTCLMEASRKVGALIRKGDAVVFESTVYPGTTEDICIPEIERVSGLRAGRDFDAGYSPERVNPGDREHTVENICKIVSGNTPQAAERIRAVYAAVLKGGVYEAPSIKVAEAAKIIENTQRDVNIAFINEVAKVFNALDIDTEEVLRAASTKWNFLNFRPGLVGGHCISVDPYYLIRHAELHGLRPRLMTEARNINEAMGFYLAERVLTIINRRGLKIADTRVLLLGFSFKENCPDVRNTKVSDTAAMLMKLGAEVTVFDPVVDEESARREYPEIPLVTDPRELPERGRFDVVVKCVDHEAFRRLDLAPLLNEGCETCSIVKRKEERREK